MIRVLYTEYLLHMPNGSSDMVFGKKKSFYPPIYKSKVRVCVFVKGWEEGGGGRDK